MSNEISISFSTSGLSTITADVWNPAGAKKDSAVSALDAGHPTLYLGDSSVLSAGALVQAKLSGKVIGSAIFKPTVISSAGAAIKLQTDFLKNVTEGDWRIDITTTPWQIVNHAKGDSGTEFIRKNLYDVSGDNIGNITTIIARSLEP